MDLQDKKRMNKIILTTNANPAPATRIGNNNLSAKKKYAAAPQPKATKKKKIAK